jgi:transcriptional regulator with XRE-family HTH domain
MTEDLHDILRKVRVLKNFSQEYVAEKVGVSLSSYARYESKKVEIDFRTVFKLAELYKMTVDELVHYGDPDFKVEEPKLSYQKKWNVPITVTLDGTNETLKMWMSKLVAINGAL